MELCNIRRGLYTALEFDFENYPASDLAQIEQEIRNHDLFSSKNSFHNILLKLSDIQFSQFINDFYFLIEQFNGILCDSLSTVGKHPAIVKKDLTSPARYLISMNLADELGYYKGSYQDGTYKNSHLTLYFDLLKNHNSNTGKPNPGSNVRGLIDLINLEVTSVEAQLFYLLLCEEVALNVSAQLSVRCGENNYSHAHGKYEPTIEASPRDDLHQLDIAALLGAISMGKQNRNEIARVNRIMDSWHAYLLSLAPAHTKELTEA